MASSTTTAKRPTAIADVTGKKGGRKGPSGPRTKPLLLATQERIGAVTHTARAIAARNGGYVNAEMIYRELASHPAYQEMVRGPEGIEPVRAYDLLSVPKVKAFYDAALKAVTTDAQGNPKIHAITGEPVDPHVDYEEGGPKKGAIPRLASARGRAFVDADEL